ncbi:hypothetical protein, partial [Ancylomarina sp. 16SWW S1-10-2]|uniref:hypothetical protein n=1 Tax=Ancylomarina sp. 16SWW S1-10-2 TaxID=2499681 RepID=UPI001D443A8F
MPIKKVTKRVFLPAIILVLFTSTLYAVVSSNSDEPNVEAFQSTISQQKATLEILKTLDRRHFVDVSINDDLSARFLDNYIDRLDPTKSYFLQADINEFKQHQFDLDDELKKGNNELGFSIYHR